MSGEREGSCGPRDVGGVTERLPAPDPEGAQRNAPLLAQEHDADGHGHRHGAHGHERGPHGLPTSARARRARVEAVELTQTTTHPPPPSNGPEGRAIPERSNAHEAIIPARLPRRGRMDPS